MEIFRHGLEYSMKRTIMQCLKQSSLEWKIIKSDEVEPVSEASSSICVPTLHFPTESPWKLRPESDQNMQTEAFSAEKLAELIKAQAIKSQAAPSFDRFDIDKLKYEIGKTELNLDHGNL